VTTVNIFSSVNKIVLTSLDEYFSATVLSSIALHDSRQFARLSSEAWQFLSTCKHFTR